MSVLVTSASSAKALVISRSLGRKGIDVIATDSDRFSAAFFSKYCKCYFLSPHPERSPFAFINALENALRKRKIDVLMPVNSTETLLISKYKKKLELYTKVPYADYFKMVQLHDKKRLMEIAAEIGIPIPQTYVVSDVYEIRNIAEKVAYPVVIKPRDSTSSRGVHYAHSEEELIRIYRRFIKSCDNSALIQEYIPGDGYGVSVLFNQGELRALFTHRRLREYPITGGPSTLRESVRHPEMERIAVKLLEYMEWHGVAMVEFKLDKRTNKPVLIEVNPRFWGSINQAIASGVDFPYLLYKMATEGDIEPVFKYKLGVKTGLLMNDLRALFSILRHSNNRIRNFRQFLKFKGIIDDVISREDMLPILFFIYTNTREMLNRG